MATFIARQLRCLFSLAWVCVCVCEACVECLLAMRMYVCLCVCVMVRPVANRLILSCGYPRLSAAKC